MDKLNIVILGDGLLGSELQKQTNWPILSRKNKTFDINNVKKSIIDYNNKIDIIVNCIAHTNTYSLDKEDHWNVNCVYLKTLIDHCNDMNIKLVHISTDYVYTGSNNNASEDDVPVHCNNWYGYTKLVGDALIELISTNYLIIRCTHKPTPFPYDAAWTDQIGNFDYVDVIADMIVTAIEKNAYGILNIGTEPKSMYLLALETKLVDGVTRPKQVPSNTTMNTEKYNKLITNG